MTMSAPTVIVFGPTGAVGSAVARRAAALGAKVILAMRDTTKNIPELDSQEEQQSGSYQRIEADLTNPDTLYDAVKKTQATKAFFYLIWTESDHMKGAITAMKKAGVEEVCFLSSFTVREPLRDIPSTEAIPYPHAQVELQLEEIYGPDAFYALRPGAFASNNLRHLAAIKAGTVELLGPDSNLDCIVPEDIGRVGATVLLRGTPDGARRIYLYGPRIRKYRDILTSLGKEIGKEFKLVPLDKEEQYKRWRAQGQSEAMAKYSVRLYSGEVRDASAALTIGGYGIKEEELGNVEKYSGIKGTTLEEYLKQNKASLV